VLGCYLIGSPGAGKSTLMAALTDGLEFTPGKVGLVAFKHYRDPDGRTVAAELGAAHDLFPGTDRLSMAVQPDAVAWVQAAPAPFVFGEGDRLATIGFLEAFAQACDQGLTVLWLDTPDDVARGRSAGRSSQNEGWQKGRRSKVRRLAAVLPVARLDGRAPLAELVVAACALVPAFPALHAAGTPSTAPVDQTG
jgi:hypothetical protein